jgi:hypothetical protein
MQANIQRKKAIFQKPKPRFRNKIMAQMRKIQKLEPLHRVIAR